MSEANSARLMDPSETNPLDFLACHESTIGPWHEICFKPHLSAITTFPCYNMGSLSGNNGFGVLARPCWSTLQSNEHSVRMNSSNEQYHQFELRNYFPHKICNACSFGTVSRRLMLYFIGFNIPRPLP
jgi:hypothetical protein